MKKLLSLILVALIFGCQVPSHEFIVEGQLKTNSGFEYDFIHENQKYKVQVTVPPELRSENFSSKLYLYGPSLNRNRIPAVGARWDGNDLEVGGIIFMNNTITIALDAKKSIYSVAEALGVSHLGEAEGVYSKPKYYSSLARDQYASVARVKMLKDRKYFGFVGQDYACTATLIGSNIVLTNAHCIGSQDDCDYSSFEFSDYWEKDFFYNTVVREYDCKKLIYSSIDYDFSVAELSGNPSSKYPVQKVDLRPLHPQDDSWVYVIGYSPRKGNKRTETCQLKYDTSVVGLLGKQEFRFQTKKMKCDRAIVPGDSGSSVFNHLGHIVGVVWGSQATQKEDYSKPVVASMTPTWLLGVQLRAKLPPQIFERINQVKE